MEAVSDSEKMQLNGQIKKAGMKLLEKKQGVLIENIRRVMIDYDSNSDYKPDINFLELLSKEKNIDTLTCPISFQKLKSLLLNNVSLH